VCIISTWLGMGTSAFAAHAYAQFGDIKYPAGFAHFEYVNPKAPKGGEIALVPMPSHVLMMHTPHNTPA
jgi:microcin C transport system substrate-binding protein